MPVVAVPEQGQLVEVRHRRYVVTEVRGSALPVDALSPSEDGRQHLVTLTSVDDEGAGDELEVVWELEPGARPLERATLPDPARGFDDPARLDAFLDAVRWGAVSSADVRALHAPFRSGITIEDYQLDPVVRALQMPRVNLLIADDVGLGKTIEAGLVVQELLLRHRARTVLVVCPAALQIQWRDQMRDKFGLEFRIIDSELLRELRRRRGLHVNPWSHFPRLITSIDFLKRERSMRLMAEVLPSDGEAIFPRRFDLLIIDEAHNVAPARRAFYAVDSLRTQAIRTLAPHFEHKLFLTATPHNGHRESFTALLELLDNQRFHRDAPVDAGQLAAVMVRRLKSELPPLWDGKPRFHDRKLIPIEVDYTDAERRAHRALTAYATSRQASAQDGAERLATEFVLKLLKKRLFSSPAAFATTLEQHERSVRAARRRAKPRTKAPAPAVLQRLLDDLDESFASDDDYEAAAESAVETGSLLFGELSRDEERALAELRQYAESASGRPDTKAKALLEWLRETVKPAGHWNDNRVIIFTEYRATQNWLLDMLAQAGLLEGERVMTLYGGMKPVDRERIKAAFQAPPADSEVRILVGTDAASEGIDLQRHCCRLVHYEIPWNPSRLEQRNGRVDRHGQHHDVLIHHFVGAGWDAQGPGTPPGALEGDLEFLMRAALKVNTIREDLGKVGPVIAAQIEEAMLGRRIHLDTDHAVRDAGEARAMLRVERKLREQIDRLADKLHESRESLRLSPANVQAVVEVGLALAGQLPLVPAKEASAFHLPPLTGSWARCAEGLANPHSGKVRPIVFDHEAAADRDDVVLAHLNHRLVQMCLALLRAEVFAKETPRGLRRVTARLVDHTALANPAVVAHARLVVFGTDSAKLHEEIITAGGGLQKGRFARLGVRDLDAALAATRPESAPAEVAARMQELWPSHRDAVLAALEARSRDRTHGLTRLLEERATKEAGDLAAVLHELERLIVEELGRQPPDQLTFWPDPEREQFQRDRDSLRARAAAIPAEIERETAAIRQRYADPRAQLFPVAITFLVPDTAQRGRA